MSETQQDSAPIQAPEPLQKRGRKRDYPPVPAPAAFKLTREKFVEYSQSLFPAFEDRITIYIYRLWPKIDREKVNRAKYIDKLTKPVTIDELIHMHGSGDYQLNLTDSGIGKEICRCIITGEQGIRDPDRPPLVSADELVMTDPVNASYIDDLRRRGLLKQPEDNDVANNQAVTELSRTLNSVTERLLDQKTHTVDTESIATAKSLDIVSRAADMANKMVDKAVEKVSDISGKQADSLALVDKIVSIVRPSSGGFDSLLPFIQSTMDQQRQMGQQMVEMQGARLATLESLVMSNRGPERSGDIFSDLNRLAELKEIMPGLFNPPAAQQNSSLEQWLPSIAVIVGAVSAGIHNWAVGRTGQGQPMAPPTPPTVQHTPTQEEATMQQYIAFLKEIEAPLLNYFNTERRGEAFAQLLVEFKGPQVYEDLRKAGKDTIAQLMQLHPPLAAILQHPRWPAFCEQFLSYSSQQPQSKPNPPQAA